MASDLLGEIVVIKRNGGDGARFPLKTKLCTFGRDAECDIRIQIPQVEEQHAKIFFDDGKIWLQNLSSKLPTLLNSRAFDLQEVNHNDIFTITQRSFRFEFPERRKTVTPKRRSSIKTPLKALQGSPRTPSAGESLKTSITKLRRNSAAVPEENVSTLSPFQEKSSVQTPTSQKENTPENELLAQTPSILKKKKESAKRSDKKRISFGPNLSPELFDKTLPPSTPLKKGTSPARRLSEPLRGSVFGGSAKKRCSLATNLGKLPIMEEEDETNEVDLCDTPPLNLPKPLLPAITTDGAEDSNIMNTQQDVGEESQGTSGEEDKPKKVAKMRSIGRSHKLATPIRRQIRSGVVLKATRKRLNTPLRKDIEAKPKMKSRIKKMATPLRKEIKNQPALRKTKQKLATPLRESIQKGVSLRSTKMKLNTPLREEIQKGTELRQTKQKMPAPLQDEIKSKPSLRETKRIMRKSLQDEIIEGKQLQSKFAGLKKVPEVLLEEIATGKELKKLMKTAPTPFKKEIKEGVKLRETKRKMRRTLQAEIVEGKGLRKTMLSAPTPFKKEIKDGVKLRETKRKMRRTLQAEIVEGKGLRKTMLSAPTPLRKAIKDGTKLRKTKKLAPTPLRTSIQRGVTLRKTKKKLNEDLQAEIKEGKDLRKTKLSAPTPLRKEIKAGVSLRKTKKALDSRLQREIQKGKELRKTKKSAPTPFKKEIKKGVKLRATKKQLIKSLQSEIKAGATLKPLLKRVSRIPVRALTNSGAKSLDKNSAETLFEAAGDGGETTPKVLPDETTTVANDTEKGNCVSSSSDEKCANRRPILKAKRQMAKKSVPELLMNQDAPKMVSAKVEKPARKKVCRRSTPKKMVELRGDLQSTVQEKNDAVGSVASEEPNTLSPEVAFPAPEVRVALLRDPSLHFIEVSKQDHHVPDFNKPVDASNDVHNMSKCSSSDADTLIGLKELMKTPKEDCVIEANLGLKRLLKTPRTKKTKTPEVKSDLGLKRLMKTPKPLKHDACVEENLGLHQLMKTPEESSFESPESLCVVGIKCILNSPPKTEEVELNTTLGLKRLMKTPKQKKEGVAQVESHLGLTRLMRTPKEKNHQEAEIEGDLGLQRLMRSSKAKNPSVASPHLDSLFSDMRERKTKGIEVKEKFGLTRLMATPKEARSPSKYSLDAGSLPALFNLPKEKYESVEDMQLHEIFIEADSYHTDSEVTNPEQQNPMPVVSGSSTGRVTRRGSKIVSKEAPKTRSTRATRGNKKLATFTNDDDVMDINQDSSSVAGASVLPQTAKVSDKDADCPREQSEDIEKIPANASEETRGKKATRRQKVSVKPQQCKEQEKGTQPATKRRRARVVAHVQDDVIEREAEAENTKSTGNAVLHVDCSAKEEVDRVSNSNDSTSDIESPKRSTRSRREVASKANQRRATRSAKTEETSSEEKQVTKDTVEETMVSSRSRRKRTCTEQVVDNVMSKKSRNIVPEDVRTDNGQDEAVDKPGRRGRTKIRKVVDNDSDEGVDKAGLAKGVVKTPPKMKLSKTVLQPIPEDAETQIDSVTTDDDDCLVAKVISKRSRRKVVSSTGKENPATRMGSNDGGDDSCIPIEPLSTVPCRQTRRSKKNSDAGESQDVKRTRSTRSAASKQESSDDISTEEMKSTEKRSRQVKPTVKPTERSTRRSTRNKNC